MLNQTLRILRDPISKQSLSLVNKQSKIVHVDQEDIISGILKSNNHEYFIESGVANLIPDLQKMNLDSTIYQT